MGRFVRIKLILLSLVLVLAGSSYAKLEFDGTIVAELISDPQNFDPTVPGTNPWLPGEQGGMIVPGYYVGHFTKINLNLAIKTSQVDAYLPLTLGFEPFYSGGSSEWRSYLVADDYMNIPYYMSMEGPVLSFAASSKPVEDILFGFRDCENPLGILRRPNSNQPIMTFKADANLSRNLQGKGYFMLDQLVQGMPIWEKIPESILDETVGTKTLSEYGFIDEIAQFSIAKFEGVLNPKTDYAFFIGNKIVDNPSFRWLNEDGTLSAEELFLRWGYEKTNFGFGLNTGIGDNIEIISTAIGSNVKWYKYDTARITNDNGYYARRWYPKEICGQLSGFAGSLKANCTVGNDNLILDYLIVEPTFQAVGAVHDQFTLIERLIPRSQQDLTLERKTQLFFEPTGELSGKTVNSSPVVDYLGRKKLGATFVKRGQLSRFPVEFTISGREVSTLGEPQKNHKDPKTGAYIIKDYRGVETNLAYRGINSSWSIEGKNYNYMADEDYLRLLGASYQRHLGGIIMNTHLEKVWRLKELGQANNKGSALRLLTSFTGGSIGKTSYSLNLDFRQGDYDYDLLEPISDQVVAKPYSYLGLSAYVEKNHDLIVANRNVNVTVAGELFSKETNLESVNSGKSLIGYFDIKFPLTENFNYQSTNILVNGPELSNFPSGRIKNISYNELSYRPAGKNVVLRLCSTTFDRKHHNSFGVLTMAVGQGNLQFTVGRGSSAVFKDSINLPGTLPRQDFYYDGQLPSQLLAQRPWAAWDMTNFNALYMNQYRSTAVAWPNYITVRYWLSF